MSLRNYGDGDCSYDFGPPEAEIRRAGRWTYHVAVVHGWLSYGPYTTLGRRWAERTARRRLAAYLRKAARHRNVQTITIP